MYNAEIKEKWFEVPQSKSQILILRGLFRISEPFEEDAGKDFAELDIETIKKVFRECNTANHRTLVGYISYFKNYVAWYSSNVNPVPFHDIFELRSSEIDVTGTIARSYIKSERELIRFGKHRRPEDGEYFLPMQYMLWHGCWLDDFFDLKMEDVHVEGNAVTIQMAERNLTFVSQLAADCFSVYLPVTERIQTGRYGEFTVYSDGKYFIKSFAAKGSSRLGERVEYGSFTHRISGLYAEVNGKEYDYTALRVFESGKFYRTYIHELEGFELDRQWWMSEFGLPDDFRLNAAITKYKLRYEAYKKALWS